MKSPITPSEIHFSNKVAANGGVLHCAKQSEGPLLSVADFAEVKSTLIDYNESIKEL